MTIYPDNHEAFVYLWYDSINRLYYLGSHKGTPDDGYTHSSSRMQRFTADEIPEGFSRRILAYGTFIEMRTLESDLLADRYKKCWDRYYNKSVWTGKLWNETSKQILSEFMRGENNPSWGGLTEEHAKKISATMKGTRTGNNNPMHGRSHKESTKEKMAARARLRKRGWVTEPNGKLHLIDPTTFVLPEGWTRGMKRYEETSRGRRKTNTANGTTTATLEMLF